MKSIIYAALLLMSCGTVMAQDGNDRYNDIKPLIKANYASARANNFDYSRFNYTWTANGVKHTSNVTDLATDPTQISALRSYLMNTASIPGTLNSSGEKDADGNLVNHVKYNTPPTQAGFTALLYQLNNGATVTTDVSSSKLLDNVTECDDAYIVSFSGSYDMFYIAAKGKARKNFVSNWELLSPTSNDPGIEGAADFYQKMMDGNMYYIPHDCSDIARLKHYYKINPGEGNEPDLHNVTLVVPKNRMENWNQTTHPGWEWGSISGKTRDDNDPYCWYNPTYAPRVAIYQASLTGDITTASNYSEDDPANRLFTVKLDWVSNLKNPETLNWPGGETYHILQVLADGSYEYIGHTEDITTYSFDVQQQKTPYQLHYLVVCHPSGSNIDNPVGPAITNVVTLSVPGYNDEFIWIYGYRSRFEIDRHANSYKNGISLSPYKYDMSIAPVRTVYRKKADGSGITEICSLNVDNDGSYTLTYHNPMATNASSRFDNEPLVTTGNIGDKIVINDYFLASTMDGGDQAGEYIYYISEEKSDGSERIEQISIPVYDGLLTTQYNNEYRLADALADTKRTLKTNDHATVGFTNIHNADNADLSYDLYREQKITYGGVHRSTVDVTTTETEYTGCISINSFYGKNTYGTNPTTVQGGELKLTHGVSEGNPEPYGVKKEKDYFVYMDNIEFQAQTADGVAPYVYYYRLWRCGPGKSEVLLNTATDNKGNGWGTNYGAIKKTYPVGNGISSTDIYTMITDIYKGAVIGEGQKNDVTYIARMYTTPQAMPSSTMLMADDDAPIYVTEARIVTSYDNNTIITGVTDLDVKTPSSVTYYNLQGIAAATPFPGMNIVVTRYGDGTTQATRLVK